MAIPSPIRLVALCLAAVLAGCAYAPGDVDNPLTRRVTWFSFIAGDDLRADCRSGAPDRFRLVYNGNWDEQVRIYELGLRGERTLDARVIDRPSLSEIALDDPLAPWRGKSVSTELSPAEYDRLLRDLEASGAYRSPAETLTLASNQFYWTAASCHGGVFHLTAWLYPSEAFARATFPAWLGAVDLTGVPFNPPRPWEQVRSPPWGTTGEPTFIARPQAPWTIGIAQDALVSRVIF